MPVNRKSAQKRRAQGRPLRGVSTLDCETTHTDAPGPALSKPPRGPSRLRVGGTDENATAGFLVVQVRGLRAVPGKIPQASARLTSYRCGRYCESSVQKLNHRMIGEVRIRAARVVALRVGRASRQTDRGSIKKVNAKTVKLRTCMSRRKYIWSQDDEVFCQNEAFGGIFGPFSLSLSDEAAKCGESPYSYWRRN